MLSYYWRPIAYALCSNKKIKNAFNVIEKDIINKRGFKFQVYAKNHLQNTSTTKEYQKLARKIYFMSQYLQDNRWGDTKYALSKLKLNLDRYLPKPEKKRQKLLRNKQKEK